MVTFLLVFITVYTTINYYLFRRGTQALSLISKNAKLILGVIFIIPVFSYVAAKSLLVNSDSIFYDILLWLGSFWFAYLVYFLIFTLLIDEIRFVLRKTGRLKSISKETYSRIKLTLFVAVIFITSLLVVIGYNNANNIVLKTYEITIPKNSGNIEKLSVLFFSDSHFTPVNNGRIMNKIIAIQDSVEPDLILIAGDIIDDKSNNLKRYGIDDEMRKLKAKFGVYACNGNHEHIADTENAVDFLTSNGITVLADTFITINNSVQIIGREDRSITRFRESPRKPLGEILKNINPDLPTILLDHQPFELEEAAKHGIDLQLSGHTHHGQIFPGNWITSLVYEVSYGFMKKLNTQYYVTSGVGTWGPPVRIGSDSEIVHFVIHFK
ncbi:MAG TPA: metallophosphoesterase [Ignavibacteriaceae bacterium]|nr:metallophosphoesterase [Ignavibacteriaceae bacterium]